MKGSVKSCFICGHDLLSDTSAVYQKCLYCGHEIRLSQQQSFIINDILCLKDILGLTWLDSWKLKIVSRCMARNDFLLDIGSGSGQFLQAASPLFKKCAGIEVTPDCIDFARKQWGLRIESDIDNISEDISVVTFWQTLEHIPKDEIERILSHIQRHSSSATRVIISVPNNRSLQYRLLAKDFTYYDPANHVHQFCMQSLNMLMAKFGFEKSARFHLWPYAVFGYLQGFLNKINAIHNYMYERKKRGHNFNKNNKELLILDCYNFLMAALLALPAVFCSLFDLLVPEQGGVVTLCYIQKKN